MSTHTVSAASTTTSLKGCPVAPNGIAGFVLANGSLTSKTSGEGEIRRKLIEADLVDCIVAMPGQLFFNTRIPVSLWFLAKTRANDRHRDRRGTVLFIDASALGRRETRTLRVLSDTEVARITTTTAGVAQEMHRSTKTYPAFVEPPP